MVVRPMTAVSMFGAMSGCAVTTGTGGVCEDIALADAACPLSVTDMTPRGLAPLFGSAHGIAYANGAASGVARAKGRSGEIDLLSPFLKVMATHDTGSPTQNDSLRYKVWQTMVVRGQYEEALEVRMEDPHRNRRKNEEIARALLNAGFIERAERVDVGDDRSELDRLIALQKVRDGRCGEIGDFTGDRIFQRELHSLALQMLAEGKVAAVRDGVFKLMQKLGVRKVFQEEVQQNLELAKANQTVQRKISTDEKDRQLLRDTLVAVIQDRGERGERLDDVSVQLMKIGYESEARKVLVDLARRQGNKGKAAALMQARVAYALAQIGMDSDALGIFQLALSVKLANRDQAETLSTIGNLMLESGFVVEAGRVHIPSSEKTETDLIARCVAEFIRQKQLSAAMKTANRCKNEKARDQLVTQVALAYAQKKDFFRAQNAVISDPKLRARVYRLVAIEMVSCGMDAEAAAFAENRSEEIRWFVNILVADRYMRSGRREEADVLIDQAFGDASTLDVKLAAAGAAIEIGRLDWAMPAFDKILDSVAKNKLDEPYWLNRILEVILEASKRLEHPTSSSRSAVETGSRSPQTARRSIPDAAEILSEVRSA